MYVHLDLDVLDPDDVPGPVPGARRAAARQALDVFEAVAADCELVGLEITAFFAPEDELERQADASVVLGAIEPLLEAIPEGERVGG